MTRKLTIATVAFFCLLGGLAYAAGSASANVRDGQACSTAMPASATWRMTPDSCRYLTPYGGYDGVSRACTELDVFVDGQRLTQRLVRHEGQTGWGFGAVTAGLPRVLYSKRDRTIVNNGFRVARVYCWHS